MIASISAVSAATESLVFMKISEGDTIAKNKGHDAIQVNANKKVGYYSFSENGLLGENVTVKDAVWDFGDKSKKVKKVNATHTYKKSGWYTLKITANLTGNVSGMGSIGYQDYQKTYRIHVVKKADLKITKIVSVSNRGSTILLTVNLKNQGAKNAKANLLGLGYGNKKLKLLNTVKIPALKAGKSAKVTISINKILDIKKTLKSSNLVLQKKYNKYGIYLMADAKNQISESVKSNNIIPLK